jgi:hypothetical protein
MECPIGRLRVAQPARSNLVAYSAALQPVLGIDKPRPDGLAGLITASDVLEEIDASRERRGWLLALM